MHIALKKSRALVGVVAVTGLLAAGCGGSSGGSSSSSSAAADTTSASAAATSAAAETSAAASSSPADTTPVTLSVNLFGTFGYKENGLFDKYQTEHPNVTIKYNTVEQESQYWDALQTHLAAGSGLGDVQGIEVGRVATVVQEQADKWVDLNTLGGSDLKKDFFEWKWQEITTKDGKTLGLGTDIGPLAICYRPDLLKQAGLPSARDEIAAKWKTWDDFLALGAQYKGKVKNSAWIDSSGGLFQAILGQSPEQYYTADGTLNYKDSAAVKNAWTLASKAAKDGLTAKFQQFATEWNAGFSNGAFATIACPSWMIGYIKGQAKDGAGKWDVATIPGNGGNWGGSYLGIPAASKNQQAAFELIKWLTNAENEAFLFTKAGNFPSNSAAANDPSVTGATDAFFSNAPIGQIFKGSADKLPVQILGPGDGTIKTDITNALLLIEQKGTSPDAAWKQAEKDITRDVG